MIDIMERIDRIEQVENRQNICAQSIVLVVTHGESTRRARYEEQRHVRDSFFKKNQCIPLSLAHRDFALDIDLLRPFALEHRRPELHVDLFVLVLVGGAHGRPTPLHVQEGPRPRGDEIPVAEYLEPLYMCGVGWVGVGRRSVAGIGGRLRRGDGGRTSH